MRLLGEAEAYIGSAYVRESFRNAGVWTCLCRAREVWALDRGLTALTAACRLDNEPIKKAFQREGFVMTGLVQGRMCTGEIVQGFSVRKDLHRPLLSLERTEAHDTASL